MDALALAVAVISALIALAALWRDNETRKLVRKTVLAPELRPLLEAARDVLGQIVASGGMVSHDAQEEVNRIDRRLPELVPGIVDANLHDTVSRLCDRVREVFARGRSGPIMYALGGDIADTSSPEDREAWAHTADFARDGQEAALAAVQRLSQLQGGG